MWDPEGRREEEEEEERRRKGRLSWDVVDFVGEVRESRWGMDRWKQEELGIHSKRWG
jgi:hypothetical protein